ncbi:MAG: helix-turn-helix domain-containing protein [Clostridium butyricum]|nr:helix-turn-helix domain-containing protein [Clostridium butyricum]
MKVPKDLNIDKEVVSFDSKIYIKKYIENAPSKIFTNVEENLFVFVLEGKKKVSTGDYITTISKGEFALFKKGNYIMNQIVTSKNYESLLIFISDEYFNEIVSMLYTNNINSKNTIPYVHGCAGEFLKKEINMVINLVEDNIKEYNEILSLKIKEILMYLIKDDLSKEIFKFIYSCSRNENNNLKEYMESNFDKCNNILKISEDLHMSLSTFKRRFQLCYGMTPGKWISKKRLEKARILLETTDYSVTDICFLCGYESLPNFIEQFKKEYKQSPKKYKKLLCE